MYRARAGTTYLWLSLRSDRTGGDACHHQTDVGPPYPCRHVGGGSGLTGQVETPVITKQMLDRHTRAGMSEEAQYAYMASRQAFEQARIDDDYLRQHEIGCIFGNDSSAKAVREAAMLVDEQHDTALLGYGRVFQSMNSTVTMNLTSIFHLKGVNFTVSAACSSFQWQSFYRTGCDAHPTGSAGDDTLWRCAGDQSLFDDHV